MTRREALIALRDAVRDGDLHKRKHGGMPMATACYPRNPDGLFDTSHWNDANVMDAYHGSLDAALALHNSLAPGWVWSADSWNDVYINPPEGPVSGAYFQEKADNPARAWLLALLGMLIAKEPKQ